MDTIAREPEHSTVLAWAERSVKALPSIVATAAAMAGLADAEWRPTVFEGATGIEILLTGRLGVAYTGRDARTEIAKYTKAWGGCYRVLPVDGRMIAEAMVKVEGFAAARVWADTGPAPASDEPAADTSKWIPAELGPGVS